MNSPQNLLFHVIIIAYSLNFDCKKYNFLRQFSTNFVSAKLPIKGAQND